MQPTHALTPVKMQTSSNPFPIWLSHDHFMSPLGGRVLLFEFSCGAVPPWADEDVDALD
jgi:hypothetical protein